jgi:hypothetical protein
MRSEIAVRCRTRLVPKHADQSATGHREFTLSAHLKTTLSRFEQPRDLRFVTEIPRTHVWFHVGRAPAPSAQAALPTSAAE